MELTLNLLWLLLAFPAVWLWRHSPVESHGARWLAWGRPLLLLACIMVLLFPVISATDDLHAMRSEIEEPGISKRSVRLCVGERSSLWLTGFGAPVSEPFGIDLSSMMNHSCGQVLASQPAVPETLRRATSGCRAPPTLAET